MGSFKTQNHIPLCFHTETREDLMRMGSCGMQVTQKGRKRAGQALTFLSCALRHILMERWREANENQQYAIFLKNSNGKPAIQSGKWDRSAKIIIV